MSCWRVILKVIAGIVVIATTMAAAPQRRDLLEEIAERESGPGDGSPSGRHGAAIPPAIASSISPALSRARPKLAANDSCLRYDYNADRVSRELAHCRLLLRERNISIYISAAALKYVEAQGDGNFAKTIHRLSPLLETVWSVLPVETQNHLVPWTLDVVIDDTMLRQFDAMFAPPRLAAVNRRYHGHAFDKATHLSWVPEQYSTIWIDWLRRTPAELATIIGHELVHLAAKSAARPLPAPAWIEEGTALVVEAALRKSILGPEGVRWFASDLPAHAVANTNCSFRNAYEAALRHSSSFASLPDFVRSTIYDAQAGANFAGAENRCTCGSSERNTDLAFSLLPDVAARLAKAIARSNSQKTPGLIEMSQRDLQNLLVSVAEASPFNDPSGCR